MIKRLDTLIREPNHDGKIDGAYLIEVLSSDEERSSMFDAWTCTTKQYNEYYKGNPNQDSVGRIGGMCFVAKYLELSTVSFWGVGRGGREAFDSYEMAKEYAVKRTVWFLETEHLYNKKQLIVRGNPILAYLQEAEQRLLRLDTPDEWKE